MESKVEWGKTDIGVIISDEGERSVRGSFSTAHVLFRGFLFHSYVVSDTFFSLRVKKPEHDFST